MARPRALRYAKPLLAAALAAALSSVACAIDLPFPDGTLDLSVTASQGAYADRIRVEWPAVPGASGYRVYASAARNGAFEPLTAQPASGLVYDFSALAAPYLHYFKVSAIKAGVETPLSPEAEGWASPARLEVDASAPGELSLSWDAVPGVGAYIVEYALRETGPFYIVGNSSTGLKAVADAAYAWDGTVAFAWATWASRLSIRLVRPSRSVWLRVRAVVGTNRSRGGIVAWSAP